MEKNRTLIRRTRSESEKPFSFVPRMQKGGGSISLWDCMISEGIGDLVFLRRSCQWPDVYSCH